MASIHDISNWRKLRSDDSDLKSGDGGGTSGGMSTITREEIDAKLDASTARTEKAFAEMKAEVAAMRGDFRASFASVPSRGFIVVTALAIVGSVIGAMAFGASQFGNGVMVTSAAVQDAAEAKRISQENAAEIRKLSGEVSNLVQAIQQSPMPQFAPAPQQGQ